MILSTQQLQAIENGESEALNFADAGSWTIDEMNLLADEADEIISRGETG